jgi:hypothetical protein
VATDDFEEENEDGLPDYSGQASSPPRQIAPALPDFSDQGLTSIVHPPIIT